MQIQGFFGLLRSPALWPCGTTSLLPRGPAARHVPTHMPSQRLIEQRHAPALPPFGTISQHSHNSEERSLRCHTPPRGHIVPREALGPRPSGTISPLPRSTFLHRVL